MIDVKKFLGAIKLSVQIVFCCVSSCSCSFEISFNMPLLFSLRNEITELSINITVENVTLSNEEVLEIMNRAPPAHLESYLPLPLYMGRMGKSIGESQGSVVQVRG